MFAVIEFDGDRTVVVLLVFYNSLSLPLSLSLSLPLFSLHQMYPLIHEHVWSKISCEPEMLRMLLDNFIQVRTVVQYLCTCVCVLEVAFIQPSLCLDGGADECC